MRKKMLVFLIILSVKYWVLYIHPENDAGPAKELGADCL